MKLEPTWSALLWLDEQPSELRRCYELLEGFVEDLAAPATLPTRVMDKAAAARLGYLIDAARHLTETKTDPSWSTLLPSLAQQSRGARDVVLLKADPSANDFDELASKWGLRRGLSTAKLQQLTRQGAC